MFSIKKITTKTMLLAAVATTLYSCGGGGSKETKVRGCRRKIFYHSAGNRETTAHIWFHQVDRHGSFGHSQRTGILRR